MEFSFTLTHVHTHTHTHILTLTHTHTHTHTHVHVDSISLIHMVNVKLYIVIMNCLALEKNIYWYSDSRNVELLIELNRGMYTTHDCYVDSGQ